MERLKQIKSLTDRDGVTIMEVITDKNKHIVRLPYDIISYHDNNPDLCIRDYKCNIRDYIKLKKIITREYDSDIPASYL